jgi:hypothetical protein
MKSRWLESTVAASLMPAAAVGNENSCIATLRLLLLLWLELPLLLWLELSLLVLWAIALV